MARGGEGGVLLPAKLGRRVKDCVEPARLGGLRIRHEGTVDECTRDRVAILGSVTPCRLAFVVIVFAGGQISALLLQRAGYLCST